MNREEALAKLRRLEAEEERFVAKIRATFEEAKREYLVAIGATEEEG